MIELIKRGVYFFWDILTLGKGVARTINGSEILFPPRWHKYFQDDYEKQNFAFVTSCLKPGMVVIDVGAHLGLMSVFAGKIVGPAGQVFAFEPAPVTFSILQRVIHLNKLEDIVKGECMSVSNLTGLVDFYVDANRGSNANSLVPQSTRDRRVLKSWSTSLSEYVAMNVIKQVDFVKIDAEGVELSVMQGARDMFAKFNPYVILAVHPRLIVNNGETQEQVYDSIDQNIFAVRYEGKLMDREAFLRQTDFFDVHLIPRARS